MKIQDYSSVVRRMHPSGQCKEEVMNMAQQKQRRRPHINVTGLAATAVAAAVLGVNGLFAYTIMKMHSDESSVQPAFSGMETADAELPAYALRAERMFGDLTASHMQTDFTGIAAALTGSGMDLDFTFETERASYHLTGMVGCDFVRYLFYDITPRDGVELTPELLEQEPQLGLQGDCSVFLGAEQDPDGTMHVCTLCYAGSAAEMTDNTLTVVLIPADETAQATEEYSFTADFLTPSPIFELETPIPEAEIDIWRNMILDDYCYARVSQFGIQLLDSNDPDHCPIDSCRTFMQETDTAITAQTAAGTETLSAMTICDGGISLDGARFARGTLAFCKPLDAPQISSLTVAGREIPVPETAFLPEDAAIETADAETEIPPLAERISGDTVSGLYADYQAWRSGADALRDYSGISMEIPEGQYDFTDARRTVSPRTLLGFRNCMVLFYDITLPEETADANAAADGMLTAEIAPGQGLASSTVFGQDGNVYHAATIVATYETPAAEAQVLTLYYLGERDEDSAAPEKIELPVSGLTVPQSLHCDLTDIPTPLQTENGTELGFVTLDADEYSLLFHMDSWMIGYDAVNLAEWSVQGIYADGTARELKRDTSDLTLMGGNSTHGIDLLITVPDGLDLDNLVSVSFNGTEIPLRIFGYVHGYGLYETENNAEPQLTDLTCDGGEISFWLDTQCKGFEDAEGDTCRIIVRMVEQDGQPIAFRRAGDSSSSETVVYDIPMDGTSDLTQICVTPLAIAAGSTAKLDVIVEFAPCTQNARNTKEDAEGYRYYARDVLPLTLHPAE